MAKNRLPGNQIYMGQLYTPDSERVPEGLYKLLEDSGVIEPVKPKLVNPIADYDGMNVAQALAAIEPLDDFQRKQVLAYEQANANRVGITRVLGG